MRLAVILATAATVAAGRGSSTREEQLAAENAQLRAEVARLSLQTATPSSGGWVAPKIEGLEASKPNIMIIFGDDSADARASFLSGDWSSCGTRPSATSILTQLTWFAPQLATQTSAPSATRLHARHISTTS